MTIASTPAPLPLDPPLIGRSEISFRKNLVLSFWLLLPYQCAVLGVGIPAILIAPWLADRSIDAAEWRDALERILPVASLALLFAAGFPLLNSALFFFRRPRASFRISYEVGERETIMRDDNGLTLTVPWRLTRSFKLRGGFLVLVLTTRDRRAFPASAFTPDEFERIVARARRAAAESRAG